MQPRKILIVEDDPDVREGLHVRLKANDYDTVFAIDAISVVNVALVYLPDLIILDLGLPGGDGFVVIESLKRVPALARIPIIVVSARDVRGNQERALKAGVKAFLQKPADNTELLSAIRQALGQTAQVDEANADSGEFPLLGQ